MNYCDLKIDDKNGIHEVLFQLDIIGLNEDDKVEEYFNLLPDNIKKDGVRWGFSDTVVQDNMCEFFSNL